MQMYSAFDRLRSFGVFHPQLRVTPDPPGICPLRQQTRDRLIWPSASCQCCVKHRPIKELLTSPYPNRMASSILCVLRLIAFGVRKSEYSFKVFKTLSKMIPLDGAVILVTLYPR